MLRASPSPIPETRDSNGVDAVLSDGESFLGRMSNPNTGWFLMAFRPVRRTSQAPFVGRAFIGSAAVQLAEFAPAAILGLTSSPRPSVGFRNRVRHGNSEQRIRPRACTGARTPPAEYGQVSFLPVA